MYEKIKQLAGNYSKYLVIILLIIIVFSLFNNIKRVQQAQNRVEEAKERVERLRAENEALKRDLEQVQSEEFVEKQLRDELGYVKEGEIVVVLPDDQEFLKNLAPEVEKEETLLPDPNWKKWMKLFI